MREYPWLFRLSLTNLLQSLSGLLFAFVLHFLFNSLDIGRLSAGWLARSVDTECVLVCVRITLPIKLNGHRFLSPKIKFQKSASEWPPVVRCVFTVIVVFCCLLSPYESWFQVNFSVIFSTSSSFDQMHRNKSDSIFVFDENLWSAELTCLATDKKWNNGWCLPNSFFCVAIRSISTIRR